MSEERPRLWCEEDGIIRFSVTSDGTIGREWVWRLAGKGFRVGGFARQVLNSSDFRSTSGVTTEVAVLKGLLFDGPSRITKKIRLDAERRKLSNPNAEIACLIRERFTDAEIEAMGLQYIVVMHEPIADLRGDPRLLDARACEDGQRLGVCRGGQKRAWDHRNGFAFAVSVSQDK